MLLRVDAHPFDVVVVVDDENEWAEEVRRKSFRMVICLRMFVD